MKYILEGINGRLDDTEQINNQEDRVVKSPKQNRRKKKMLKDEDSFMDLRA